MARGYDPGLVEAAWQAAVAFPQAGVDPPEEDPATARAVAAAVWTARVWGTRSGWACVCCGWGGRAAPHGGYRFTRWEQRWFHWPRQRDRLLSLALAAAGAADVYAAVLLWQRPTRAKGLALPGLVAWADVDGPWTPERQRAVDQLTRAGRVVWQVASGTGRHVYLPLDQPEPPERLEGWNQRLACLLAADSGWSQTKVLRVAGTWNHKPRAHGHPSLPVGWIQ